MKQAQTKPYYNPKYLALSEKDPKAILDAYDTLMEECHSPDEKLRLQFLRIDVLLHLQEASKAQQELLSLISTEIVQNDLIHKSICQLLLANSYHLLHQHHLAMPCYDSAYESAKRSKDHNIIVKCLIRMSEYQHSLGNIEMALKHLNLADKTCPDANLRGKIRINMGIGTIYYEQENYAMATKYMSQALVHATQSAEYGKQVTIMANLSQFYLNTNRHKESISILQNALSIAEKEKLLPQKGHILNVLASRNMVMGNYQAALEQFLEALFIAERYGCDSDNISKDIALIHISIVNCYNYLNNVEAAKKHLTKTDEVLKTIEDPFLVHDLSIPASLNAHKLGLFDVAMEKLNGALKFFRKHKKYDKVAEVRYAMGELYEASGKLDKAILQYKELPSIHKDQISQIMQVKTKEYDEVISQVIQESEEAHRTLNRVLSNLQKDLTQSFVGKSQASKHALETALLAANHPNASVMITGESGTGKEVLASIIHHNSIRASYPFITVNTAAISRELFESEFFGHKKGSFTGAVRDHVGYFLQANKGTLYLDEIGDMRPDLQIKLLTVLESRKVTPVGSSQSIPFDCRIVCSTNANMMHAIGKGTFRLDLFHRLNTVEIHIDPLRARKEDIPVLLNHYLRHFAKEYNRSIPRLDEELKKRITCYNFPGNVRELRNLVERLYILNPGSFWDASVLDWLPCTDEKRAKDKNQKLHEQQEELQRIVEALEKSGGIQRDAAKLLNMSQSTLCRRIVKYGLHAYTRNE